MAGVVTPFCATSCVDGRDVVVAVTADGVVIIRDRVSKALIFAAQTRAYHAQSQLWFEHARVDPLIRSSHHTFQGLMEFVLFSAMRARRFQTTVIRLTSPPEELERQLWKEMGFEFVTPLLIAMRFRRVATTAARNDEDVVEDKEKSITADDVAAVWAHPLWTALEHIADDYPSSKCNISDVMHTLSEMAAKIRCPKCRAHYQRFCLDHDPSFYLRTDNNRTKTRVSFDVWVNKCHNEVNARNGKWLWSIEEVRAKLSSQVGASLI